MRIILLLSAILCMRFDIFGQVTLQSGSASYSIPIFSFSDSKSGLATDITLTYSSGNGLKVTDKASNTGQYWNLIAGGAIVRRQNGEPDDQNSTSIFPTIPNANSRGFNESIAIYDEDYQSIPYSGDTYSRNYIDNYFPNGFMYSEFPLDMTDDSQSPLRNLAPRELAFLPRYKSNMDKRWKLSRRAITDRQQDVFDYEFNGISGEFVIGKDGSILLLNDSKIVVEKSTLDMTNANPYNIRTRINQFTITDEEGVLYKFSAYELSEVMKLAEVSTTGTNSFRKVVTSGTPTGKYTIQKWLLTEITNPITLEKIVFEYEDYSVDLITDKTPSYQNTEGQTTESVQVYEQRVSGKLKRLKNIILPDGHKVQFNYATSAARIDVPGDSPLSQIKISYNSEDIISYNLAYGYFLKKEIKDYTEIINESDKRFARLCLTSIQKTGNGMSQPPFKFSYYTGSESSDPKDIIPSFDCMAQDHWGFYNKTSIINNDDPDPTKEVLKDLLSNNNTYRQPSSGAAKFGLLKTVENPLGGKLTYEYEQNDSKDSDNPSSTVTTGGVRVFRTTTNDGINSANDIVVQYNYKLADGTTSGWGFESPTYLSHREIKIWNASTPNGYTQQGALVFDITTALGKLVVKQGANVALKAAIKSGMKVAEKAGLAVYPMPEPVSIAASIIISGLVDRLFVLFNPNDYLWTNTYNFNSYQAQNPIGINYSRVEVLNTSMAGGTGKTVFEYTVPSNVRSEIPALQLPYSSKQRFPSWRYGLLYRTSIYSQTGGAPIKEITNNYSFFPTTVSNLNHMSSKVEVVRPESASCWAASYNLPITDFSWESYYPITGHADLTSTIEKNYSPTSVLSESQVSNTYNSYYLQSTITSTKSNGDQIVIKNYYPNNYDDISTAIQDMKSRNMISIPISSETWLKKPNNDEYLIDATINEFTKLTDGQIKLKKVFKFESKEPITKAIIGDQVRNTLIRNPTYFKEQENLEYNILGLPVQTISPGGESSSSIFDYNNRLVVATVSNASPSNIAYTSFEADGKGNWEYDNSVSNYSDVEWVTGKKCFKLVNGASSNLVTKNNLDPLKTYIVSYWAKNGSVLVNNQQTSAIFSSGGWSLYIHQISGSSTASISGSAIIDEVRLYPKGALMSTATFQPGVGKSSECDPNNRIIYYEYDELRRLRIIRDENRNIVKMYEYNYKH